MPQDENIIEGEVISLPLKDAEPYLIGDDVLSHSWDEEDEEYADGVFWHDDDDEQEDDDQDAFSSTPPLSGTWRTRAHPVLFWASILVVVLLLALCILGTLFSFENGINPFTSGLSLLSGTGGNTTTAFIMVTPEQRSVHLTPTLPVSAMRGIRLVPSYTVSVQGIQHASGRVHHVATPASGILTFYNASFVQQSLPAGTRLTTSTGITLVTDARVTIAASVPPTEGYATVEATTIQTGYQSNITTGTISGVCCGQSMLLVENSGFTGGRDATTVSTIEPDDTIALQQRLKLQGEQQVEAHQQAEVLPGEQLSNILSTCTPTWSWQGQPGDAATQVTASLKEVCQDVAIVPTLFTLSTMTYLGQQHVQASYEQMTSEPVVQVTRVDTVHQRVSLDIQVSLAAIFSSQTLQTLQQAVAGMSQQNARSLLSTWPGMGHYTLQVTQQGKVTTDGSVLLPGDISNITMMLGTNNS